MGSTSIPGIFFEGVCLIPLSRGYSALIDAEDIHLVAGFSNWYATVSQDADEFYALSTKRVGRCLMHRRILGAADGEIVDHKNGCTLDNRRCNLRKTNHSGNLANAKKRPGCTSVFKGVCKHGSYRRGDKLWKCACGSDNIGDFYTEREAAEAYDNAAVVKFGEFALTNRDLGLLHGEVKKTDKPPHDKSNPETHPMVKLGIRDVEEIRLLLRDGMPQGRIGKMYGVCGATVGKIKRGQTWNTAAC